MRDFVAYPSRWRIMLLVFVAIAFVGMGLWFIGAFGAVPVSRRYPPEFGLVIGYPLIILFSLYGTVDAQRLFASGEELRIGSAGVRWARWSDKTIPWSEIADVTTKSYKGHKLVVLHLRHPELFRGRGLLGMMARASLFHTGGGIGLRMVGTDRSFAEAMAAIDHFRAAELVTPLY